MSSSVGKSPRAEDLISTEDDTLGSSISLSVGENSIRIKEKPKSTKETEQLTANKKDVQEKWWLKRPETRLEVLGTKNTEAKMKQSPTPSSDVSSSMKEFLEKEKMCKTVSRSEGEVKDKDDTLCDILASAAFDKYPSDFENATDEDIGSILEEMSKIAGALSPSSGPERIKSDGSSKVPTEEEKSVEELLEEAEKLVRKNSSALSKSISKSDTLVPENDQDESLNRVRQLEADIFQLIEEEMHKESEKIKKSPKNEKKRENSPGFEIVYENLSSLKPPKTLELQRRKFEEQKVEISSSSDLDDPIERHSKSEELKSTKKMEVEKENLQKEITDVDKNFFEDLLKRSKEKAEGGMSGSSSFGQEDFSHFLKLLQGQTDKKEPESKEPNTMYDLFLKSTNGEVESIAEGQLVNGKTPEFPEKEFSEILGKELPTVEGVEHEIHESDSSVSEGHSKRALNSPLIGVTFSKNSSNESSSKKSVTKVAESNKSALEGNKKINTDSELYTVGLTPRLELFADTIPKLMAEKLSENVAKESTEKVDLAQHESTCSEMKIEAKLENLHAAKVSKTSKTNHQEASGPSVTTRKATDVSKTDVSKADRVVSAPGNKQLKKEIRFCKSKSYDQICQPPLRTSLENIRVNKASDVSKRPANTVLKKSPTAKSKMQSRAIPKNVSKPNAFPKSKLDPAKTGSTSSLPAAYKGSQLKSPDTYKKDLMAAGDSKQNTAAKRDWEMLCREEKHKNAFLKQQLEAEAKLYKSQIEDMRASFERELFALKKQNIILKARVDELSLNERRPEARVKNDTKVALLEQELEKQENLIRAYETENKRLIQDTKRTQEELKSLQSKQKSTVSETNDTQQLADRVKDLQEETLKLNLEVSELREKNADYLLKNDDLIQQNSLLTDELDMFKEQLKAKNNFITDRLQAMTSVEIDLKRQIEDLSVKLSSKSEQLRLTKLEMDKLQQNVVPLEKELLELRVKEKNLQEKLQISKSHVEREKQLTQRVKDQVILDNKRIIDLNRQVREMERILKRKNPDSVSALILTANSEQEKIGSEKVKLLEERIASLENEIKTKEEIAQQNLVDLQKKFSDMKEKYTAQVVELETKLLEATAQERKLYSDVFTQTIAKYVENKGVETNNNKRDDKEDKKAIKVGPKSQNPKEDAHLIATIRGLKLEIVNKDKAVSKVTKEFQELQKTNRRLQKEREKLLNDRRSFRSMDFDRVFQRTRNGDANDQNSNVYQNGHIADSQRLSSSTPKLYDPMQYTENGKNGAIKKLTNENDILKEELSKMNKDFMALKSKRLHDLNLLQEEHEREMATLVKEYSVKFGDSKVVKLQGQINTQGAIISHLKEQMEKFRDYKEQVVVLKAEREHLENKVKTLTEKVKYLMTPGTEQLQLLQDKITILQQRHESREMTLQTLVRDLLRNRTQCKDCRNEKGKNRQLCYFRQELDHILEMLQEIANVH